MGRVWVHNCSVKEKAESKSGEDVLEKVEKFCYLGDIFISYGGASSSQCKNSQSSSFLM